MTRDHRFHPRYMISGVPVSQSTTNRWEAYQVETGSGTRTVIFFCESPDGQLLSPPRQSLPAYQKRGKTCERYSDYTPRTPSVISLSRDSEPATTSAEASRRGNQRNTFATSGFHRGNRNAKEIHARGFRL